MRNTTKLLALAAGLALTACAYNPPPIPVLAPAASDLATIAGEWNGEYRATMAERSGTISFKLAAGADTAFGEVVMLPRWLNGQPMETRGAAVPRAPVPLTVRFVRVRDGFLSGALEVYVDPDLGCLVETSFRGRLVNGVLEGTFETRDENGYMVMDGSWRVTRAAP
jgi:hypothetical protein